MQKVEHVSTIMNNEHVISNTNQEWIDVADFKEIFLALFYFFLILFSILFFGIEGHQEYTIYNPVQHLFTDTRPFRDYYTFDFELLPFNSKNRFLKFYLYFYRNTTNKIDSNISFKYLIKFLYSNITEYNSWHNIDVNFHFENGQSWTNEYPLYNDYMLDFKSISVQLKIAKKNNSIYKGFEFGSLYCSTESTQFIIYFNAIFTISLIISLIALSYKKMSKQIKLYRVDQIFLFPLIILMLLSNNPFFFFHIYHPTRLYYYCMMFFVPICDAFIYFTILFLMFFTTSCNQENNIGIDKSKKKLVKFSIITFVILLIFLFVMIAFNYFLTNNSLLVNFPKLFEYQNIVKVEEYKSSANAIFTLLMLILLLSSFLINDDVNASSIVYTVLFMPIFIQEFCFNGIFPYFNITDKKNEAAISMAKMIIQNLFCLFLVYIHWPFDIREKYTQIDANDFNNETFADVVEV